MKSFFYIKLFILFLLIFYLISCSPNLKKYSLEKTELEVVNSIELLLSDPKYWDKFEDKNSDQFKDEKVVLSCDNLIDHSSFSVSPLEDISEEILERIRLIVPNYKYSRNIWVVSAINNPPYGAFSTVWYVIDETLESIPSEFSATQNARRC